MQIRSILAGLVLAGALTASPLALAQDPNAQPATPSQPSAQSPGAPEAQPGTPSQNPPQSQSTHPSENPTQGPPAATTNPGQDQAAGRATSVEDELQLTEEQKAKLQPILQEEMRQIMAVRSDTSLSTEEKRAKIDQIRQTEFPKIQAILTPEQQQKLAELQRRARQEQGTGQGGDQQNNPGTSPQTPQPPQQPPQ
jgi:periplasmic protein CpxP/Spy